MMVTTCLECGHKATYHRGPRCHGAAGHAVGFWRPGHDERCPCRLSEHQVQAQHEQTVRS